ncbi:hypothetical protein TNCV_568041 [Trichonephila clavipes]|nr:hypothetical protein TNCV_568041 [Trichonephila clavipes]
MQSKIVRKSNISNSTGTTDRKMCGSSGCNDFEGVGGSAIVKSIATVVEPLWVPTRMFSIKISEKKGFVTAVEDSVKLRCVNIFIRRLVNARQSDEYVVT